ncbi:hypothetical protein KIPB_011685, partial [Kipferlia bialata]|eukprot:g11685.t1
MALPTLRCPEQDSFDVGGIPYVSVYKRKTVMGGMVTCCMALIYISLAISVAVLLIYTPSPDMPSDITADLPGDSLLDRQVMSTPISGLGAGTSTILNQWTLEHDNLYVTEVVGGDWGTTCVDYGLVKDLSFADTLQVMYAASAGVLPASVQSTPPTTSDTLRQEGCLGLATENCTLLGSKLPCSAAYSDDVLHNSITRSVMAYGCYRDDVGVYHHLTLLTMRLHSSIPQGDSPVYTLTWNPSDAYPLFGTQTSGIKQHVLPPAYNLVGVGSMGDISSPYRYLSEPDLGILVMCGWMPVLGYQSLVPGDDPSLSQCFGMDGVVLSSVHRIFGATDSTYSYAWDGAGRASTGVGPYPTVASTTLSDVGCRLTCGDDGNKCFYEGR